MTQCLTDEVVLQLVEGRLPAELAPTVDQHITECADCSALVAETARLFYPAADLPLASTPTQSPTVGVAGSPGRRRTLAPRSTVSRYQIEEPLGIGGGGIVYRAYDPQLRRKVALKLIRQTAASAAEQQQLLREAQAMARLAHPNVVNVHDAGTIVWTATSDADAATEEVFIVMELVDGITLARWLKQEPRTWRDVLSVFMEAGRGLAAAHAAQLVHRDFKPENVLIGTDGRVRVSDFGLARALGQPLLVNADAAPGSPAPASEPGREDRPRAIKLSTFAGTPLYMAPEQFLGKSADARTDPFSFAVALYVSLYGEHPFGQGKLEEQTLRSLARDVTTGKVRTPPPGRAPDWLREVIMRGLAVDPAARFATMDDLLAALARGLAPTGPRALLRSRRAAAVLMAAMLVAAAGAVAIRRAFFTPHCGNQVVEGDEQCDDGNNSEADGCLGTCRFATCGDGLVRRIVEECDDGNRADDDGCTSNCLTCGGPRAAGTPSFFFPGTGGCYTRHDTPQRWFQAREMCRRLGGDLVAYWTHYEAYAVGEALLGDRRGAPSWIGLRDLEKWESGEPPRYVSWGPNQPSSGTARCASEALPPDGPKSLWALTECTELLPFVCERAAWTLRPKDNHAYRFFFQSTTWPKARDRCHRLGAVSLVVTVLDDSRWSGPVNAVSPGIVTNGELTRVLGRVLRRPTLIPVPAIALRLALGELAGQLLGSRRVIPRAALGHGFRFAHPELEPALREALDD